MTPTEAFSEIESFAFSVRMNVASGLHSFLFALAHEEALDVLVRGLTVDRDVSVLAQRLFAIASETADARYEHPRDVALASYLWLLAVKQSDLAEASAEVVMSAQNTWWSRKIASILL